MHRAYTIAEMTPGPLHARGLTLMARNDEPEDDEAAVFEEAEEDDDICIHCNGSGEGQYDGTRCRSCGGSGVERTERDEPDWDALRKERAELAHLNGDE